jgi:hypothetical protein
MFPPETKIRERKTDEAKQVQSYLSLKWRGLDPPFVNYGANCAVRLADKAAKMR